MRAMPMREGLPVSRWLTPALVPIVVMLAACATQGSNEAQSANPRVPGFSASGDGGVPPFYTWNERVPSTPGQLLRTERQIPSQSLAEAGRNIRLLYTSTDGIDDRTPIVVSGALYLPKGTPPKGGWPLMAWAHGTVGMADICAPSYTTRSPRDTAYLNHWLALGYAVVATDYQGLGTPGLHPYGLTRPLAYGVLDSIRAVSRGGFDLSKRVVVFGQSQGGRAAFATAVYAKDYAPELNIVGVIATGTPYATVHKHAAAAQFAEANRSVVPTFAYEILRLGTATLLDPSLLPADYLNEKGMAVYELSQHACLHAIEHKIVSERLTFNDSFKRSPKAIYDTVNRASAYPTLRSDIPIFMGAGAKDHDVFTADQTALVVDACKAGDRIEWHLYSAFDHSATVNGSLPDSTIFARRAFAGETIEGNCAAQLAKP